MFVVRSHNTHAGVLMTMGKVMGYVALAVFASMLFRQPVATAHFVTIAAGMGLQAFTQLAVFVNHLTFLNS